MTKLHITRKKINITQAQLARIIGCTRASVNQAENRGIQNPKTALRYAKALNCKWQDLLEDPKPEAAQ